MAKNRVWRGRDHTVSPGIPDQDIQTNGTILHVRVGGQGPAAVLLHGYAETGDVWGPLAADLVHDHTIVVPDLRGMGLSSRPPGRLRGFGGTSRPRPKGARRKAQPLA